MDLKLPISIIVPVYNEGSNITHFLEALKKALTVKHEIIIVYDFDQDDTVPVVKKIQNKYSNIKLVKNNLGRGLINACKVGFNKAKGNFIVVMPGDLADNPKAINNMYKLAKQGYDIVCGTRYSKGGKQLGGGLIKSSLSRFAGLATPLLLGIPTSDLTNGFKLYNNKLLKKINIESQGGWEFAMEILLKAHHLGFKITETPSIWTERSYGKSKFKLFKWLPYYTYWYLWGIKKRILRNFN